MQPPRLGALVLWYSGDQGPGICQVFHCQKANCRAGSSPSSLCSPPGLALGCEPSPLCPEEVARAARSQASDFPTSLYGAY